MDTTEQLERRATTATFIAAGICLALTALSLTLIMRKVNATRELNFLPVLIPFAFSIPAILFQVLFTRIQARLRSEVASVKMTKPETVFMGKGQRQTATLTRAEANARGGAEMVERPAGQPAAQPQHPYEAVD